MDHKLKHGICLIAQTIGLFIFLFFWPESKVNRIANLIMAKSDKFHKI